MKIVINSDFGGFGLSDEAIREYAEKKGFTLIEQMTGADNFVFFYKNTVAEDNLFLEYDIPRNDEDLVEIVERMGENANGRFSSLKVIEIPENVNWYIEEYDGREHVAERHRTWY